MDLASIRLIIDLLSLIHQDVPNRYQLIMKLVNQRRESNNLSLYNLSDIKTIIYLFESCRKLKTLFISHSCAKEQIMAYNMKCDKHEIINTSYVTSFTNTCIQCNQLLVRPKTRSITYFKQTGVESALLFEYRCTSINCGITYCGIYYQHPTTDRITITPTSILHHEIIYLGGDFAYEKNLITEFTSDLLFNHATFYGFANAYNYRNNLKKQDNTSNLRQLQDKHFQGVWIQYQLACMLFMTSTNRNFECLTNFSSMPDLRDRFLREQNNLINPLFMILWTHHKQIATEEHIYKYDHKLKNKTDKCSTCLVADGHEKPSRLVCAHKSTVSLQHHELGEVEIGCSETPLRRTQGFYFTCLVHYQISYNVTNASFCRKHQPSDSNDVLNATMTNDPNVCGNLSTNVHKLISNHDVSNNGLHKSSTSIKSHEQTNIDLGKFTSSQVDEQIKAVLGLDDNVNVNTDVCNVYRDSLLERKNDTSGFMAIFYDCGIIVAFQESIRSESVRRLLYLLLSLIKTVKNKVPNALLYDNACSLRLFIDKWYDKKSFKISEYTKFIKEMHIAIDRFHEGNHRRTICQTIMRADHPSHENRFAYVNSEICEQMFSYFTKFKSAFRNYSYPKSVTFYMLLFHLKNCQLIGLHPSTQSVNMKELNDYWQINIRAKKRSLENIDFHSNKKNCCSS
ncbi:hypothetical protein I4U23_016690 [Adineta vaga]|nr:hypothetical protein I4U23_016690 [Adineta vaga]